MSAKRDFKYEMEQLKDAYPEVEHIPEEVARAAANGQNILEAYEEWQAEEKTNKAEIARLKAENAGLKGENERLKKEVAVLKQNARAGARAVGGGVQGGAQDTTKNAFLAGLESGGW